MNLNPVKWKKNRKKDAVIVVGSSYLLIERRDSFQGRLVF